MSNPYGISPRKVAFLRNGRRSSSKSNRACALLKPLLPHPPPPLLLHVSFLPRTLAAATFTGTRPKGRKNLSSNEFSKTRVIFVESPLCDAPKLFLGQKRRTNPLDRKMKRLAPTSLRCGGLSPPQLSFPIAPQSP